MAHAPKFLGHIAAARKRSHQWCVSLTQTILKQWEEWHVIVCSDQLGETLQAAATLLKFLRCSQACKEIFYFCSCSQCSPCLRMLAKTICHSFYYVILFETPQTILDFERHKKSKIIKTKIKWLSFPSLLNNIYWNLMTNDCFLAFLCYWTIASEETSFL